MTCHFFCDKIAYVGLPWPKLKTLRNLGPPVHLPRRVTILSFVIKWGFCNRWLQNEHWKLRWDIIVILGDDIIYEQPHSLKAVFSWTRKHTTRQKQCQQMMRALDLFWQFKRNLGGLFCPPVLEVKAKIYFLSPKIQIYVFLLPASEKGLRKEKHGLKITKNKMTRNYIEMILSFYRTS